MSCEWSAKLDRYLDSELAGGELTEMEAHLRACPACASDALNRVQLKRAVQGAGQRFTPRPEFRLKMERSLGVGRRPRWAMGWVPGLAAAAGVFAAILIMAAVWLQHARGEQAVGELADLHVSTLASANPIDVASSDRHTVKPWFQGKIPFTFNLPELQGSGFKLIGGRVAYFQQSPGAQLLFEAGKHRISVFIFQDRDELSRLNSGSALSRKLAFNSETWTEGGLRYFAVGDAGPPDIHGLRRLLERAAG